MRKRLGSVLSLAAAAALSAGLAAIPAVEPSFAGDRGVKAGALKCDVEGGWGFVFGSTRDVNCVYTPADGGRADRYTGTINDYGVNIGYLESAIMLWAVVAPTKDVGAGALAGTYGGASADVAAGFGVGAKILVGGFDDSIALQPVSIQGNQGLNIAAGVANLNLTAAK